MDSADHEVLTTAADWLDAGHAVYLATVARTWGSSPRPPGALLAVRASDARFVGSVSGGCVEDDWCARLAAHGAGRSFPALETYGVTAEQTARFGLPCGGRLELLVERLDSAAPVRALLAAMHRSELVARRVCLATGEASLHPATRNQDFSFDGENLVQVFGPAWRLVLIGSGQLSRLTAQMALALDYEVIVCDPREDMAAGWSVAGVPLDSRSPDEAVQALVTHTRTAVVALTHDPRLDDLALLEALQSHAFYVGALGSRVNSARRRARLRSLGLSETQLARLHAPVGLAIGSRTPAEIAVSILAELTAVRHGLLAGTALQPLTHDMTSDRVTCSPSPASC